MPNYVVSKIVTGNQGLVKNLNSNIVLNLVRTKAPISGADLAKMTGMRPATIQNILKNLKKDGLVKNIGTGTSTRQGGRRPILWNICSDYGYVIGIQLEINDIEAVLVNLKSEIVDRYRTSSKKFESLEDIERIILAIIDRMTARNGIDISKLLGVGIGVSGIVDIAKGALVKTSLLGSSEQPIYFDKALQKYVNLPVYIENDANAAVLAEHWFGSARGKKNTVVALSVVNRDVFGIGFGLILKNEIYRGANMFAGETFPFDLNIEKILRKYCRYQKPTIQLAGNEVRVEDLELQQMIDALSEGDTTVVNFIKHVGNLIGKEIIDIVNLLDPEMVIIGGEIAKAGETVLAPIRKQVDKNCLLANKRNLEIVTSTLDGNSVPLGAATIILQQFFQEPSLAQLRSKTL